MPDLRPPLRHRSFPFIAAGLAAATLAGLAGAARRSRNWWDNLAGPDSSNFVDLDQIKKSNVDQLEVAWSYPYATPRHATPRHARLQPRRHRRCDVHQEPQMNRREFFSTAAGVAALASTRFGWAAQAVDPKADWKKVRPSTLDRIAIMTLNFQSILKVPDTQDSPNRTLELFDIGEMLADTYGVHKVEFQHYHLASVEPSYFRDLKARLEKAKSRATQINLEFSGLNISAPQQRDRLLAIDLTKMWVDHAVTLGAQRVMINQGQPTHENKAQSIPTLKAMVDYGKSKNIIVSVETRGGGGGGRGRGGQGGQGQAAQGAAPATTAQGTQPATAPAAGAPAPNPPALAPGAAAPAGQPAPPAGPPPLTGPAAWTLLAEIIKGAGAYSNVDVGGANAANQEELHACLKLMFPMTANNMHTRVNMRWDLATAMRYLEGELGYKGLYTIEASNGHEGTRAIYDVVVATLDAKT